jgi:Winged helix-turn-helix domain (DUF2582)
MQEDISNAAGVVWRYLDEHGASALSVLKRGSRLADPLVFMAIGWLAREGKIDLLRSRRGVQVSLRDW